MNYPSPKGNGFSCCDIIKKTDIPASKIGKLWKFKRNELDEWVKSGRSAID